jgi:ribosomal protein L13
MPTGRCRAHRDRGGAVAQERTPTHTPFIDTGDHVDRECEKVKLNGRKEDQKIYRQHSGWA